MRDGENNMAQIPVGNFGNRGPDAVQHTRISDAGQYEVDGAVRNLANVAGNVAAVVKQKDEDQERLQAANALNAYKMSVSEVQEDLNSRNKKAELNAKLMPDAYNSALTMLQDNPKEFDSWGKGTQERFLFAKDLTKREAQLRFNGIHDGAMNEELANEFDTFTANTIREASEQIDPKKALESLKIFDNPEYLQMVRRLKGPNAAKYLLQTAGSVASINTQYREELSNDIPSLQALITDVSEDKDIYRNLTAEQKKSAILSASGKITQIQNRMDHDLKVRESKAESVVENLKDQIMTGIPLSTKAWEEAYSVVQGTPFEADFKGLQQQQTEVQAFIRAPEAERVKMLNAAETAMRNTGQDDPKKSKQRYDTLLAAHNYRAKLAQEAPLQLIAIKTNVPTPPLDVSALADPNRQGEFAKQVSDRMTSIQAEKQSNPNISLKILTPEESKLLNVTLDQVGTDAQLGFFASLSNTLTPEHYNAVLGQLAPDNGIRAIAGSLYGQDKKLTLQKNWVRDDVVTTSANVAKTMLTGQKILDASKKDGKSFAAPNEKDFMLAFTDVVGNAYRNRPELASRQMQATRAYYVGLASQAGDLSTEVDGKRLKEAIKATQGNVVSFNGTQVFAPWGTSEDAFEDQIEASYQQLARSGGLHSFYTKGTEQKEPAKYTQGMKFNPAMAAKAGEGRQATVHFPSSFSLEQVGEGRYLVKNGDGVYVVNPKKQKIILDVLKGAK